MKFLVNYSFLSYFKLNSTLFSIKNPKNIKEQLTHFELKEVCRMR